MINKISLKADEYLDEAIELLKKLISFKSVAADPAGENAPYGEECAKALTFTMSHLKELGFTVKNFEGHAITAAFDEREPEVGVLAHLDVVPTEGQSWHSDPFTAEIRDGLIYGRGAIDDKGPAAAVITAMKIIRDSVNRGEVTLKRNMRLILGSNEENGSTDMEYYTSKEAFPPMLFTPDGSFPVITVEKGMVRYDMTAPAKPVPEGGRAVLSIKADGAYNAVPEKASARIKGFEITSLAGIAKRFSPEGITFMFEKDEADENIVSIISCGKGAHASTPEKGHNALTALIELLSKLMFDGGVKDIVRQLANRFPYGDNEGKYAGLKLTDEKNGNLSVVLSRLIFDGQTLTAGFDCRYPPIVDAKETVAAFDRTAGECRMAGRAVMASEPHAANEDSELVQTLLSVYEDFTGKPGKCLAIGGGTYVHDTENGVAFGAEWSDENHMHGADEFIGIEELRNDIVIYTEALLRLLTE
ncbi:MAG: Sapep family Mn(2+)-dependent dipeptidase [Oscillospiraceae bacterium]|nr:Sapep family Mn(2+)-dependent dipeptidase [Oscillospiraceae bacterium]